MQYSCAGVDACIFRSPPVAPTRCESTLNYRGQINNISLTVSDNRFIWTPSYGTEKTRRDIFQPWAYSSSSSSSLGKSLQGRERRDVVFFSLKCPSSPSSVHLCPPQLQRNNLPICCNQTSPSSPPSSPLIHHSSTPFLCLTLHLAPFSPSFFIYFLTHLWFISAFTSYWST